MKPSKQCAAARSKANRVLGLINRTLTYKNETNIKNLYKALVRPHLEYAVQAWAPSLRKDMKPSKQCTATRNKANRVLGLINRTLTYKNKTNVKNLYKALVRQQLQYAMQALAPSLQKDNQNRR